MNKLMRRGWQAFALLILLTGYAQATEYNRNDLPPYLLAAGYWLTCAKDDNGVQCWGTESSWADPITPPDTLGDVKQLAVGSSHACALDENGVTCWGGPVGKNFTPPDSLTNPVSIMASGDATCALDVPEGELPHVHCWVSNREFADGFPDDMSTATSISQGALHGCLIDENGMRCWGENQWGQATPPESLVNPVQVLVGNYNTCVRDETVEGNKVYCKGRDFVDVDPPVLANPIEIDVGQSAHVCALDANYKDITCWGKGSGVANRTFEYAPLMAAGGGHNCVLDYAYNRIACWGDSYHRANFPTSFSFVDYDKDGVNNEEDAFNTNPKASVDADNDGLPDDCIDEECGGLTQDPSLNDTDNDGLVNELDDVVGDNNPPVVLTVPGEGNVAANENGGSELTINPPLSLLKAEDFVSQQLTWQVSINGGEPQAVIRTGPFYLTLPSGKNVLAWQAIDEAGNVSEPMLQIVNIYPAVRFTTSESSMKEGEALNIEVSLAGESPIYPVSFKVEADFDLSTADITDLDGDFWSSESQLIEIPEAGKTNVIVKTVNNADTSETESLKVQLTYASVMLMNGNALPLSHSIKRQHTVTIESVDDDVDPGDGNGGCDCPDNGGDNNSGGDDNSGGNDNSDGDDNTSGDNDDGRDAESESSGGSSGGGSTAPFLLLALFALLTRRRV